MSTIYLHDLGDVYPCRYKLDTQPQNALIGYSSSLDVCAIFKDMIDRCKLPKDSNDTVCNLLQRHKRLLNFLPTP